MPFTPTKESIEQRRTQLIEDLRLTRTEVLKQSNKYLDNDRNSLEGDILKVVAENITVQIQNFIHHWRTQDSSQERNFI